MTSAVAAAALMVSISAGCSDEETCVEESGIACTWLGIPGEEGFNGDGHDLLGTRLYWSFDMAFVGETPWFIDWNNHIIRRVLPDGAVETMVGWTDPILPGDGDGSGDELTAQGAVGTNIRLNHPTELVLSPNGKLLLVAWHNHKLREIDPNTGRVRILAGGGAGFSGDGGPAAQARFKQPTAAVYDDDGNLYVVDQQNFRIRKIDTDGIITTIAGNGVGNLAGDPGGDGIPALDSSIDWEAGSNPEPSGGIAIIGNQLYFSETLRHRIRVIDLDTGVISTLAGSIDPGFTDGALADATFYFPRELEIGPGGDLYVADTDNCAIRAIDLAAGEVRTVVGTGDIGLDASDGMPATATALKRPFGLEFDADGNLYVMDTINSRILKVPR